MNRYYVVLIVVCAAVWIWAAINPVSRHVWLMENLPLIVVVPLVVRYGRALKLSRLSWTCIALFLILHLAGSHYTYPGMPVGNLMQKLLHTDRNHYDRLVHFAFGLLLYYPIHDIFQNFIKARGIWKHVGPLDVILALSAVFEILEWVVVMIFAPPGADGFYIGAQGDEWDAQKDMLAAGVGAAIVMTIVITSRWQKKHRPVRRKKRA